MTGLERLLAAMRDAAEVGAVAVSRWGHAKQLAKAREEAAEYSLELARLADMDSGDVRAIRQRNLTLSETADVIITAMQVGGMCANALGHDFSELTAHIRAKTDRLRDRIEAAKEGGR